MVIERLEFTLLTNCSAYLTLRLALNMPASYPGAKGGKINLAIFLRASLHLILSIFTNVSNCAERRLEA